MSEVTRYQPQIDGLRALAIIPVVLFHASVPGFNGGFVGVDIFFVLSGFLITRLLLAEIKQTGTINIGNFYSRRIRRLFPALTTVIVVVLVIGTFILSAALERQELSKSAIATMAFVSNVYFYRSQTVYFAPSADWIPLLNMWTLSVEEQLYLLWPILLMLAAWLGRRSGRPMLRIMLPMLLVILVVSLVLFGWGSYAKRVAAFYLTPARAWEFSLGGLLVLAEDSLRRFKPISSLTAIVGLVSIGVAITLLQSFFLSVVVAAFGAAAVIAGITSAPATTASRLLQSTPAVVIGKLSYSWYLWHWPLLVFSRILAPGDESLIRTLAASLGAFVLAAVTFVLIEDPIRQKRPWPFFTVRQTLTAGCAMSLTVGLLAAALHVRADAVLRNDPWLTAIDAAARSVVPPIPGCTFAQRFTKLASPSVCSVGAPDVPPRVLVWGDSQAHQLLPMMQMAGEMGSYAVVTWSMASCPTVVLGRTVERGLVTACRAFNRAVASELPSMMKAGLSGVILTTRDFGSPGPQAAPEQLTAWRAGMDQVLSMTRDLNARVLLIAPIPVFPLMLPECLAHASATQCGSSRTTVETQRAQLVAMLQQIAAQYDNVRIWDSIDLICDVRNCTPMRDGNITYSDHGHLSELGVRALVPYAKPDLDWLRNRSEK